MKDRMDGNDPTPEAAQFSRGTVLLVEEERNVRALIVKFLNEKGYSVLEATDSEEGLKVCAEHKEPIDLMICDLLMPEMNGVQLARRARSHHPALKTLYLSAHSQSSVIYQGIPLTDISYLPKPFKLKELMAKVDEMFGTPSSDL